MRVSDIGDGETQFAVGSKNSDSKNIGKSAFDFFGDIPKRVVIPSAGFLLPVNFVKNGPYAQVIFFNHAVDIVGENLGDVGRGNFRGAVGCNSFLLDRPVNQEHDNDDDQAPASHDRAKICVA